MPGDPGKVLRNSKIRNESEIGVECTLETSQFCIEMPLSALHEWARQPFEGHATHQDRVNHFNSIILLNTKCKLNLEDRHSSMVCSRG